MKFLLAASCLGLVLACSSPASADVSDIRASDKAVEVDFGGTNLKYGESVGGSTFDTETGWMPNIDAGFTWLTSPGSTPVNDLYLHLDAQAIFGNTHYNGGLVDIFNNVTPYQSTTNDTIFHVAGQVGHAFTLSDSVMLTPYLDLGFRSWRRQLTGIGSYTELYEQGEGMGGLMVQVSPMPRLVLSGSGAFGSTMGPSLSAQGETFYMGYAPIWQLDGKIGYALTPQFELTSKVEFGGFALDKSQTINGAYEPDSYTHQLSLMAGLAYHLQ